MNDKDCNGTGTVIGPRSPAVIVSAAALFIAVFALLKVLELESEIKARTRE